MEKYTQWGTYSFVFEIEILLIQIKMFIESDS